MIKLFSFEQFLFLLNLFLFFISSIVLYLIKRKIKNNCLFCLIIIIIRILVVYIILFD